MKKAFTLIELVIVGTVIAILIVIALPLFRGTQIAGNIAKAKAELSVLQTAVENYYLHNNNVYPRYLSYVVNDTPRLVSYIPQDPLGRANKWGNIPTYGYSTDSYTNAQQYAIYSVGPDGNGSALFMAGGIFWESNGDSCIFVSNVRRDTTP